MKYILRLGACAQSSEPGGSGSLCRMEGSELLDEKTGSKSTQPSGWGALLLRPEWDGSAPEPWEGS